MLWPCNAVEILADGLEGVICAYCIILWYFQLLKYWIGLTVGKDISRKKERRNVIYGCRAGCGDHI